MTDIYDQASAIEQLQRQHALDRQRDLQRAHSSGPDLRNLQCMDCGEDIDPARRQAVRNCRRCTVCETAAEAQQKLTR